MKYVSIDIETTGLNPEDCQVVEFAAVIDDLDNPGPVGDLKVFHRYINHGYLHGDWEAILMHKDKLDNIATYGIEPDALAYEFRMFLNKNGLENTINVAGKNFNAFDKQFLVKLPGFRELIPMRHRVIDPAVLYYEAGDTALPNLQTCLDRANIGRSVEHNAANDAIDVVLALRKKLCVEKETKVSA